jgi:hypothetical protein
MIFAGCTTTPYRYNFSLFEPLNDSMSFEDSDVGFRFVPSQEKIQVIIMNKTDKEIHLVRAEASYIDCEGKSHRIHYGSDYVQEVKNFTQNGSFVSPMRIDPKSEVSGYVWINSWPDFCTGEDRHSVTSQQIDYLMEPFFPKNKYQGSGEELKDTTFRLILPIDFDGYITHYPFSFRIDDVTS